MPAASAMSAKKEQEKVFIDLPREKICERAFVLAVAAACATDADSMFTMAVIARGKLRTFRRIVVLIPRAFALRG
jgi:hypothetical protein